MITQETVFDAFLAASKRGEMATSLDTAGLRELSAQVRRNSVFSARMTEARVVTFLKLIIDQLANDEVGLADAKSAMLMVMRFSGYTPEGGFPDELPGTVPPAVEGSLRDLSSFRRLDLIVDTQLELVAGAAQKTRGEDPDVLRAFPAWELVRGEQRRIPRDWAARVREIGREPVVDQGRERIIFLKGDPAWGELGSSGNFDDALDVDHAPFAFSSGMVLANVRGSVAERLGVVGPAGESIEEWLASSPVTLDGPQPLPAPKISAKGIDPALLDAVRKEFPDYETFEGRSAADFAKESSEAARATRLARGEAA